MDQFYLDYNNCSEATAVQQYHTCLTSSEAKEAISELHFVNDMVTTLKQRYYNRNMRYGDYSRAPNIQPPGQRPEAAAKYVSTVLTKLKKMIPISREAGVEGLLASLSVKKAILENMFSNTTLIPYAMAFTDRYGQESTDLGFMCGKNKFQLLLNILQRADQSLIYIRSNPTLTPMQAAKMKMTVKKTAGAGGRGGERVNSEQEEIKPQHPSDEPSRQLSKEYSSTNQRRSKHQRPNSSG